MELKISLEIGYLPFISVGILMRPMAKGKRRNDSSGMIFLPSEAFCPVLGPPRLLIHACRRYVGRGLKPTTRLHYCRGCGRVELCLDTPAPSKCLRGANKSNFSFTRHGLCSRREFNFEFTQIKYRFNLSECSHCSQDYNTSFSQAPNKPLFLDIPYRSSKIVPYDNTHLLPYEQMYIQSFHHNNELIPDQHLNEHNPMFDLLHSNTTHHNPPEA